MICDERINEASEPHIVNILVQFAATHAGEYHSFMITHSVSGATVRPVAVNRLEASLIVVAASWSRRSRSASTRATTAMRLRRR